MSDANTRTLGAGDKHDRTSDTEAMQGDSARPPTDGGELMGDSPTDELAHMVAYVLGRARRSAAAQNAPYDARAILNVAYSFADELASRDHRFDSVGFIRAVAEGP